MCSLFFLAVVEDRYNRFESAEKLIHSAIEEQKKLSSTTGAHQWELSRTLKPTNCVCCKSIVGLIRQGNSTSLLIFSVHVLELRIFNSRQVCY
jgi:hypothetical protein